jgi:hypothetical protein
MFGALLAFVIPAHAACPSTLAQVDADIAAALRAYVDTPETFRGAAKTAREEASCATESLPPVTVARLHLVGAMDAVVAREPARLAAAVAGMHAAEPSFVPPEDVAPVGSTLHSAHIAAPGASPSAPLPAIEGKRWRVDGRAESAPMLPASRAVFVQLESLTSGEVERSWYSATGATPATLTRGLGVPKGPGAAANPRRARRVAMLTATTASLAGAGVMFARASGARSAFDDTPALGADATEAERTELERDLQALQASANIGTYGWWGLGAATLVLGTVTALTW